MCEDTDNYWLVVYRDEFGKVRIVNTWQKIDAERFAANESGAIKVLHTSDLLQRLA